MRIAGLPPLSPKDLPARKKGEPFTPAEAAAPRTATGAPVQPPTSVDMLVALAGIDDGQERRRKLAAQAAKGLDELEALDRDLLAGNSTAERLTEIAAWAGGLSVPDDSGLTAILREIELRALVELAKHQSID